MRIVIQGPPIAKKRPRFARRGKYTTVFNPQETEEGRWLWEARQQIPKGFIPLVGPVEVETIFYIRRPKSHYGSGKNSGVLKKTAPIFPTTKPDVDNLQKMVYDCLNGLIWQDDACIVRVRARKKYAGNPRTEITIFEVV